MNSEQFGYFTDARFLRRATLAGLPLQDADLQVILGWRYLDDLDIRGTEISAVGLKQLVALKYLRVLRIDSSFQGSAELELIQETATQVRDTLYEVGIGLRPRDDFAFFFIWVSSLTLARR